jgi:hypothetical protein
VLDDIINVFRETVDIGAEVLPEERVVLFIDLSQCPVGLVGE